MTRSRPRHDPTGPDDDGFVDEVIDAAIVAELETGPADETVEEARRHVVVRAVRIVAGVVVLALGLVLLVLPGPGWLVIAAGLALLSRDVPFAARLLHRVRRRLPEGEDGKLSVPFVVACSASAVLLMSFSIWWTFLR